MEKIIGLVLIVVYAAWFFTVQAENTLSENQAEQEVRIMQSSTVEIKLTQDEMHNTIKNTAEREGWITTEFKSNALIAEKTTRDNSISVTVTFNKSSFSVSPKNIDLENAINSALGV